MTVEEWLGEDNKLGIDIWHRKYPKNGETFDEWLDRVSLNNPIIKYLIINKKFLPGGRILSNIGLKDNKSGMSNCYSRGFIEDDYNDIMQAAIDIGKTFKAQGGQGLSLSKLRPKGTPIGNNYVSDGIVPFMRIYNEVTQGTSQGGARKGALLMSLDAWHKEVMNFITIKSQDGLIEKANLSLEIDDEFMQCVDKYYKTGEVITVTRHENYSGHEVEWEVTPIEVFKAFIHNNYDWGDPGCLFVNRFRNYNMMEYCDEYQVETCNPCGEQPLNKHGACNLSSINLSEFVDDPYTDKASFDWSSFDQAVKQGIIYLDKIIDLNAPNHALLQQRENSLNFRNCGLGVFGYATMLMKMGMEYGSTEAIEFTDGIFRQMFRNAVITSNELAREYGTFPKYNSNLWESNIIKLHFSDNEIEAMKPYGLRNCSLLSIAPTGTIATMLNESGGCEPEFAISYTRRTVGLTDNQDHYYTVYCKAAREYKELYPDSELPNYFVSSSDIDPQSRVFTQAIMQDHVDTAISSTVNLPESCTEEEMAQIYLQAWKSGLKGLTIFRSNCKRLAILTTENHRDNTKETSQPQAEPFISLGRGDIIECSNNLIGKKRKLTTGCGSLHVLAFFDPVNGDMQEVYLNKGSTGGCANYMTGLSRTLSLLCRAGVDVKTIKDQLDSTGVCPSYATRTAIKHDTSKGSCCPMAIGNALVDMWEEMQDDIDVDEEDFVDNADNNEQDTKIASNSNQFINKSDMICPKCGDSLVPEGGCNSCKSCGYSKCD